MNPFQSDNIWKKKARQGKAQQHPLTPRQEWQKQVNSSSPVSYTHLTLPTIYSV